MTAMKCGCDASTHIRIAYSIGDVRALNFKDCTLDEALTWIPVATVEAVVAGKPWEFTCHCTNCGAELVKFDSDTQAEILRQEMIFRGR